MQGGGIPVTDELGSAWLFRTESVVDSRADPPVARRFVDIKRKDYGCTQYLQNNFAMLRHMVNLRDRKVAELVALTQENGQDPWNQLPERMPSIITIDVTTQNGQTASVNVLPGWRALFSVLKIELTDFNMQLLLEDPPAESAPWYPQIDQENMFWASAQSQVRCSLWGSKKGKFVLLSNGVEFRPGMDDEEKQSLVTSAAEELQHFIEFYDAVLPDLER